MENCRNTFQRSFYLQRLRVGCGLCNLTLSPCNFGITIFLPVHETYPRSHAHLLRIQYSQTDSSFTDSLLLNRFVRIPVSAAHQPINLSETSDPPLVWYNGCLLDTNWNGQPILPSENDSLKVPKWHTKLPVEESSLIRTFFRSCFRYPNEMGKKTAGVPKSSGSPLGPLVTSLNEKGNVCSSV